MTYLPHTPQNFREIVLADLLRAQRLILKIQDEIDPQFRIASPEGDWWIGMTLDDDVGVREKQMQLVSRFMRWKLSPAFTLASEIVSPDAVYCIGISHHECHAAMSRITRNPIRFSAIEWLTRGTNRGCIRLIVAARWSVARCAGSCGARGVVRAGGEVPCGEDQRRLKKRAALAEQLSGTTRHERVIPSS